MTPNPDEIEAAAGRLRRLAADEVTARRDVKIVVVHAGDEVVIEYPASIRMGRRALLDALLPINDAVPITAAWMDAVGGDDERGDGDRVWPIGPAAWLSVGLGGGVWHCWVRSWVREGGGGGEESVTLPQLATRGQLRRLLAALGVSLPQGGAS